MMNFLYQYHDLGLFSLSMARSFANFAKSAFEDTDIPFSDLHSNQALSAEFEIFERAFKRFEKPLFAIHSIKMDDRAIEITEEDILQLPFCNLKHFVKNDPSINQEKILIVAPLSGHFASLLRDTALSLLPHFDVFITDWKDASEVPQTEGDFSLDDYVQYVLDFLEKLGTQVNILAVCQPVVPVLIATALTHQLHYKHKPKSITLMGGPVDTRVNPTKINSLTEGFSINSFEQFIISTVPSNYPGAGRRVCPGFMMLLTFMSLHPDKHLQSQLDFIENSFTGDTKKTDAHRKFYNEYLAVMDLPAPYFLDCIHHVFHEHTLAKGLYEWKGIKIDLASITKTALMTVEGEHDDISGLGQTKAAHDLCMNIPKTRRDHYQDPEAGHYGIFSGHKWRDTIAPKVIHFIKGLKK